MPAISFSTLKDKILDGSKKQTIRPFSLYWLKWNKGDRLVGYWKMRTPECTKLFDSVFSEDPFGIKWKEFSPNLLIRDGFDSWSDGMDWFEAKYADKYGAIPEKEFVVIRWK